MCVEKVIKNTNETFSGEPVPKGKGLYLSQKSSFPSSPSNV